MKKKQEVKLTELQSIVAKNLSQMIDQQNEFLKHKSSEINQSMLTGSCNAYDLRQHIQAKITAENALATGLQLFRQEIGIPYEEYSKTEVSPISTLKDDIVNALAELLKK